jgi:calcium-dependent protein kinase
VKENIIRAKLIFKPKELWDTVSEEAKSFVKVMLNPDPKLRPSAREAQQSDWIQVWSKKDVKEAAPLSLDTVTSLMKFKESSDMQKLLSEVLSFTLLPEQIVELRREFEKIDAEGDGEISLSALKHVLLENAEVGALGALTEKEVEDIFDSIRVRKSEPRIRWHEFLAAGLSQARVDDRNLRLAFDRLDVQRRGYVSRPNLFSLDS